MSNLYRGMSPRHAPPTSSRFGAVVKVVVLLALAVGVFMLAVRWFRGDEAASQSGVAGQQDSGIDVETNPPASQPASQLLLTPVDDETGTATVTRSHGDTEYALSIVADLPTVDAVTTAYEAWFVTPGITDFFSLGELYPREDGKWGLVWAQTNALVRVDIANFNRVIIIREPRDGNAAPSADHVLDGAFE